MLDFQKLVRTPLWVNLLSLEPLGWEGDVVREGIWVILGAPGLDLSHGKGRAQRLPGWILTVLASFNKNYDSSIRAWLVF